MKRITKIQIKKTIFTIVFAIIFFAILFLFQYYRYKSSLEYIGESIDEYLKGPYSLAFIIGYTLGDIPIFFVYVIGLFIFIFGIEKHYANELKELKKQKEDNSRNIEEIKDLKNRLLKLQELKQTDKSINTEELELKYCDLVNYQVFNKYIEIFNTFKNSLLKKGIIEWNLKEEKENYEKNVTTLFSLYKPDELQLSKDPSIFDLIKNNIDNLFDQLTDFQKEYLLKSNENTTDVKLKIDKIFDSNKINKEN